MCVECVLGWSYLTKIVVCLYSHLSTFADVFLNIGQCLDNKFFIYFFNHTISLFFRAVLEIASRAHYIVDKYFPTEIYPQTRALVKNSILCE